MENKPYSSSENFSLFVGGLALEVTEVHLRNHFGRFGPVLSTNVKLTDKFISRGFGFVKMKRNRDIARVMREPRHIIAGRQVDVQLSNSSQGAPRVTRPERILVIGLPFDLDETKLKTIFSSFGTLRSCYILRKQYEKSSLGRGCVQYSNDADTEWVLNKKIINWGTLTLEVFPFSEKEALAKLLYPSRVSQQISKFGRSSKISRSSPHSPVTKKKNTNRFFFSPQKNFHENKAEEFVEAQPSLSQYLKKKDVLTPSRNQALNDSAQNFLFRLNIATLSLSNSFPPKAKLLKHLSKSRISNSSIQMHQGLLICRSVNLKMLLPRRSVIFKQDIEDPRTTREQTKTTIFNRSVSKKAIEFQQSI